MRNNRESTPGALQPCTPPQAPNPTQLYSGQSKATEIFRKLCKRQEKFGACWEHMPRIAGRTCLTFVAGKKTHSTASTKQRCHSRRACCRKSVRKHSRTHSTILGWRFIHSIEHRRSLGNRKTTTRAYCVTYLQANKNVPCRLSGVYCKQFGQQPLCSSWAAGITLLGRFQPFKARISA